jgi:hypothetical protein
LGLITIAVLAAAIPINIACGYSDAPEPIPAPNDSVIYGLRYWTVSVYDMSYMGLERSAYPGRLNA